MDSKVFLDMDGLLANLFDKVAHEIYHQPYKELTDSEKTEARNIWNNKEHAREFFTKLGGVEAFFAHLPLFGNNGELTQTIIDTVTDFAGGYNNKTYPAR